MKTNFSTLNSLVTGALLSLLLVGCTSTVDSTGQIDNNAQDPDDQNQNVPGSPEESVGTNALMIGHFNTVFSDMTLKTEIPVNLYQINVNPGHLRYIQSRFNGDYKNALASSASPYDFSPSTALGSLNLAYLFCAAITGRRRNDNNNGFASVGSGEERERFWEGFAFGDDNLTNNNHRPTVILATEAQRLQHIDFMLNRFFGPEVVPTSERESFRSTLLEVMDESLASEDPSRATSSQTAILAACVPALAVSSQIK